MRIVGFSRVLVLSAIVLAWACSGPGTAIRGWRQVDVSELTPMQVEQKARADAAREELFRQLVAELGEALEAGGAVEAIDVCSRRAGSIATRVSSQHGLVISRTSHLLRNPANLPPPWAEGFVRRQQADAVVLASGDGRLGVLTPIRTADACLHCHGLPEEIDPEVRAALERTYPQDRATGFRGGDLRGWFVTEVPPEVQR